MVLRLDELLRLRLGLRVSDFYVVASWHAKLLILLEALVSILNIGCGAFTEVVSNDTVDRRLRSIGSAVGELLLREGDLHAAAFEGAHAEGNPVIVTLAVNIVLWCRHVASDN